MADVYDSTRPVGRLGTQSLAIAAVAVGIRQYLLFAAIAATKFWGRQGTFVRKSNLRVSGARANIVLCRWLKMGLHVEDLQFSIVTKGLSVLGRICGRLARWITYLSFCDHRQDVFDPFLAYIAFHREQEFDCLRVDLKDLIFFVDGVRVRLLAWQTNVCMSGSEPVMFSFCITNGGSRQMRLGSKLMFVRA